RGLCTRFVSTLPEKGGPLPSGDLGKSDVAVERGDPPSSVTDGEQSLSGIGSRQSHGPARSVRTTVFGHPACGRVPGVDGGGEAAGRRERTPRGRKSVVQGRGG